MSSEGNFSARPSCYSLALVPPFSAPPSPLDPFCITEQWALLQDGFEDLGSRILSRRRWRPRWGRAPGLSLGAEGGLDGMAGCCSLLRLLFSTNGLTASPAPEPTARGCRRSPPRAAHSAYTAFRTWRTCPTSRRTDRSHPSFS